MVSVVVRDHSIRHASAAEAYKGCFGGCSSTPPHTSSGGFFGTRKMKAEGGSRRY